MKRRFSLIVPWILLGAVLLFHGIVGVHWIVAQEAITGSDELDYFQSAQRFERTWPETGSIFSKAVAIFDYPEHGLAAPLTLIFHHIGGEIFGRTVTVNRMYSLAAFLGTIALLFLFGRSLDGPWTGILVAGVYAVFPYALIHARYYNGFAVTAFFITGAMLFLVQSRQMTRWWAMALFGLFFGLALLSERGAPPIVLVGPSAVYCGWSLWFHARSRNRRLTARAVGLLLISVIIALAVAARYVLGYAFENIEHNKMMINRPYYPARQHFYYFIQKSYRWLTGIPLALVLIGASGAALRFLPRRRWILIPSLIAILILGNTIKFWLAFVLIVVGIGLSRNDIHSWMVAAWMLVPTLVFSTFATKDLEYVYSVQPAIALAIGITCVALMEFRRVRAVIIALIPLLVVIGLWQDVAISFPHTEAREAYLRLPRVFRFADGAESYFPEHRPTLRYAAEIAGALKGRKDGMLLYFPGQWDQVDVDAPLEQPFEAGAEQLLTELQVRLDYAAPGHTHFMFTNKAKPAMPQLASFSDVIVYLPENPTKLWKHYNLSQPAPVQSFLPDEVQQRYVDALQILQVQEIVLQIPLFGDRSLALIDATLSKEPKPVKE